MAVDDFLVPPVERNLMHLVVRQVRPKEERDKGKNPYQKPDFGGRDKKKAQTPSSTDNCVSGSKVDCKV